MIVRTLLDTDLYKFTTLRLYQIIPLRNGYFQLQRQKRN